MKLIYEPTARLRAANNATDVTVADIVKLKTQLPITHINERGLVHDQDIDRDANDAAQQRMFSDII